MGTYNKVLKKVVGTSRGNDPTLTKPYAHCNSVFGDMDQSEISQFYEDWDAWVQHTLKEQPNDWWKDLDDHLGDK